VVRVLSIDLPDAVKTLTDSAVAGLALPLGELWDIGQRNTDAKPIDDQGTTANGQVGVLTGASMFIASKAAHMDAFVSTVIGPAPRGVIFAIPSRSTLLYGVVSPATVLWQLDALTRVVDRCAHDPGFFNPGGVLSALTYFWSPDGTVETLAHSEWASGKSSTMVTLSDTLLHHSGIAEASARSASARPAKSGGCMSRLRGS
jgi:hypothetical protein